MLTTLVSLAVLAAPPVPPAPILQPSPVALQEEDAPERQPPTKEEVDAALGALKAAWKQKEVAPRVAAIEGAATVLDAKVIDEVAKGLRDKALEVQDAAVEALRWMEHPDALTALQKHWKKDKELRKHVERAAPFLKAIGQHGHPSSIALFADDPFENTAQKVVQARIYGLGRIRDAKAVGTLIDMLAKAGGGARGGRGNVEHMNDFRAALQVLTGRDLGRDANAWRKWWSENEKDFEVAKELPELPRAAERLWKAYWGELEESRRGTGREDRGGGPEDE